MTNEEYKVLLDAWHCLGSIYAVKLPQDQQASIAENYDKLQKVLCEGRPCVADAVYARGIVD